MKYTEHVVIEEKVRPTVFLTAGGDLHTHIVLCSYQSLFASFGLPVELKPRKYYSDVLSLFLLVRTKIRRFSAGVSPRKTVIGFDSVNKNLAI